jgi:hypothetical protein
MPSLIDCRSLRSLQITGNNQLHSIRDASLHTCTSLIELRIFGNGRLHADGCDDSLVPTVFPNLTALEVSSIATNVRYSDFSAVNRRLTTPLQDISSTLTRQQYNTFFRTCRCYAFVATIYCVVIRL